MKNYIISTIILLNFFCFAIFGQKNISTDIPTTINSFNACREKAMKLCRMKKDTEAIKTIEEWLEKTNKIIINEDIIDAYELIILVANLKAENNKIQIANMKRLLSFLNRKEIIADKSLAASICFTIAWYNHDIKDQEIKNRFYDSLIAYRRKDLHETKKTKQKLDILRCYNRLIKVLKNAKRTNEAMLKAKEALEYQEENIVSDDDLYVSTYSTLSELYIEQKEYSKAIEILKRYMKVSKTTVLDASTYVRIAKIYIASNNFTRAQKALKKALLNNTKSADCNKRSRQDNFKQIGKVYCDIRQYELAVKYIEKSDKKSPFYPGDMADVYFDWGKDLASQNERKKAIEKLQKALGFATKKANMSQFFVGIILRSIGINYIDLDDYQNAKTYLLKSLKYFNSKLFSQGMTYLYLARNARYHKKWKESEKYYEKSADLLEKRLASLKKSTRHNFDLLQAKQNALEGLCLVYEWLQTCFYWNKNQDKAIIIFYKIKKLELQNSICFADICIPLVANLLKIKKIDEAFWVIKKGLYMYNMQPESLIIKKKIATLWYLKARLLYLSGNTKGAIQLGQKSYIFFVENYSKKSGTATQIAQQIKYWQKEQLK